jgi:hypothetical protein
MELELEETGSRSFGGTTATSLPSRRFRARSTLRRHRNTPRWVLPPIADLLGARAELGPSAHDFAVREAAHMLSTRFGYRRPALASLARALARASALNLVPAVFLPALVPGFAGPGAAWSQGGIFDARLFFVGFFAGVSITTDKAKTGPAASNPPTRKIHREMPPRPGP